MGRDVSLYGLNYKKIKSDFASEFTKKENVTVLSTYIYNLNNKNIDTHTILSKLENYPHLLSIDEVQVLISAYTDSWGIIEKNWDYSSQRTEQIKKLGIALLFETLANNPSNVFMEQFFETFDSEKESIEYQDGGYKLSEVQIVKFIDRLIAITEFFYQKEHDSSFQLDLELYTSHELEVKRIFKEQTTFRQMAGGEFEYDQQGFNYFSFSGYCSNLTYLKKEIESFDEFLLFDSY